MIFWLILALLSGVTIDRIIIWDKQRAVVGERQYHISTIRNLEKQLQLTKLDNYAMRRERGDDVDAMDYVYENPDFEAEFARNGHAKTILHRRATRRSA